MKAERQKLEEKMRKEGETAEKKMMDLNIKRQKAEQTSEGWKASDTQKQQRE